MYAWAVYSSSGPLNSAPSASSFCLYPFNEMSFPQAEKIVDEIFPELVCPSQKAMFPAVPPGNSFFSFATYVALKFLISPFTRGMDLRKSPGIEKIISKAREPATRMFEFMKIVYKNLVFCLTILAYIDLITIFFDVYFG